MAQLMAIDDQRIACAQAGYGSGAGRYVDPGLAPRNVPVFIRQRKRAIR
jgi:hypothetical protein